VRLIPVLRPTPPADGDGSDSSDSVEDPSAAAGFTAEIDCRRTFMYCVSLIRFGLSYRQISSVMETMRSTLPGARSEFKPVTRQTASIYCRLVAACGLEALRNVLRRSWAFAIAADGSSHVHGTAYFCIRLCLISIESKTRKSTLHNVHLVAPPMTTSHTGQNMFEMTSCALDALDSEWRSKLIGCTSDGAANMTGVHIGWQSLVEKACEGKGPFFRVHCGPHRLNLVNGRAIAALRSTGSKWLDKLYVAVKLLRKQANLIEKMGCQSPYHVEVRWSSLHQVLLWHRAKSTELSEFYTEADVAGFSDLAEAPGWWLFLCIFQEHYKLINEALSAIQGAC
jgi:hypothetical protein